MTPQEQWNAVRGLAEWSTWVPFSDTKKSAPKLPGVYLLGDPNTETIVYVGMAGERAGSGNAKGLWGRLGVYRIGKGAASGFGEAVFDRALGDAEFVAGQLERIRAGEVIRAKAWATEAIAWWNPKVCWTTCATKADAAALELNVLGALAGSDLWNRGTSRRRTAPDRPNLDF
jgi:hypothetical protein